MPKAALALLMVSLALGLQHPAAYFNARETMIIAHRGASGYIPEHTLQSYSTGVAMGAHFIEPDLVLTKDGALVANQDVNLRDITDIADRQEFACRVATRTIEHVTETGWFSDDLTLSEFKLLRGRQRFADRDHAYDDLLPRVSLDDILQYAINANIQRKTLNLPLIGVYIETKHPGYFREQLDLEMEDLLYEALLRYNLTTWQSASEICPVVLQSFYPDSLDRLGQLTDLPRVLLLLSSLEINEAVIDFAQERYHGIGPSLTQLYTSSLESKGAIEAAHAAGLKVHAYTFRDDDNPFDRPLAEVQRTVLKSLDGIFTEFPDTMRVRMEELRQKEAI
jgi:glycerophosphoryl diester phosphodiesterase